MLINEQEEHKYKIKSIIALTNEPIGSKEKI